MAVSHRNAFTIVELLVVIAIISVLAAMLLPVIEKSIELSRQTHCRNNLQQLGMAFNMYVEDYSKYPTLDKNECDPNPTYFGYGGKCGTETNRPNRPLNTYFGFAGPATATTEGELLVYRCPSDNGGARGIGTFARNFSPSTWDRWGFSYLYNAMAQIGSSGYPPGPGRYGMWNKQFGDIPHPSRAVLCNDMAFSCYVMNYNPYSYMFWHSDAELGWGNVLFVDGHVQFLKATRNAPNYQQGDGWDFNVTRK